MKTADRYPSFASVREWRTAKKYPAFAAGYIVIDATDAPSLRNAIGSRIYRKRYYAEAAATEARRLRNEVEQQRIVVVPVDGPNGAWALDYIDCDGVVVRPDGQIRMG